MRKLIVVLVSLLFLAGPAWSAPTEASLIQRAKRTIQRADRSLTSLEKSFQTEGAQPPPAVVAGWEKKAQRVESLLNKASEQLGSLSGGEPERAMLKASQARLARARTKVTQMQQGLVAATSLAQGDSGRQAVEDYRKLEESFRAVSAWLRNNEDTPKMMEAYRQAQVAKGVLDQKYASVLGMRSRETFDLTAAANGAQMAQKSVESTIVYMVKNSAPWIDDQLARARDHSRDLKKNRAFSGWETSVQMYVDQAALRVKKLAAVAPQDPGVQALQGKVERATQELDAVKTEFRSHMIASNSFPADRYRGADAGAIKAAVKRTWMSKYPQDQIVKVVISTPQWSDFAGTEWVKSARRWQNYNFDRLDAYILVAGAGQHNYKFFAQVVRQNLEGGRLDVFVSRPGNPEDDVHVLLSK